MLAGIVFFWMVTDGTFDPGHRVPFSGNFYDVQAHRMLDGDLSMPKSVLSIEGYEHDGNSYMYFGPAPAFLRLPTAALTDSLDGQHRRGVDDVRVRGADARARSDLLAGAPLVEPRPQRR